MDNRGRIRPRIIALASIFVALSLVLMYLASIIQTVDLSILFIISILTGILVWEGERLAAILMFAAIAILSFILIPNKVLPFGYIGFFGWYGLLNGYLFSKVNKHLRMLIGLIAFNVMLTIFILIYPYILGIMPFKTYLIYLIAQPLFILYHYVYNMSIVYYNRKLRKFFFRRN